MSFYKASIETYRMKKTCSRTCSRIADSIYSEKILTNKIIFSSGCPQVLVDLMSDFFNDRI